MGSLLRSFRQGDSVVSMTDVLKILDLCEDWTEAGLEGKQGGPQQRRW